MIDCISVENMRLSDAQTIEKYIPSLVLMHRAAYGVFLSHTWAAPVAIMVGSGNNGGDGFALACILRENGFNCSVFTVSSRMSEDSRFYAQKAKAAGVPVSEYEKGCLSGYSTVVDCLLGTGFKGSVRDSYRTAIEEINTSGIFVVSVDINSGMNGDSAETELAVQSDLTVTIGYVKNGLVQKQAGKYMKRLVCVDIGIQLVKEENKICTLDEWKGTDEHMGYILCPDWLDMEIIRAF